MGIEPLRFVLFGSYASDTQKDWSDIDLIVIANYPNTKHRIAWFGILGIAAARIMEPIEAIPCTPDEYEASGSGSFIGDEVKPYGIEIIPKHLI